MRLRAFLLGAALLALFGVVLLRAAKVQLLDRSRLARLQRDQTRRELEWVPRRGMIVDRRGEPLAVTQDVDSVFADPSAFETPRARQMAAARIAGALRLDRARVLEKLSQPDRRFVWIKRRIDEASAQRVRGLAIDGIELAKEPKRFYPQRDLAGHVLGFVGEESGQEGLERELDQHLRGRSVQVQATRDARGTMVLEHGAPDPADLTGATVTLTLDSAIQLAAEKELARAVKASGAIGGWAVVLDVNTGAVLALAGNPAFDANKPGRDPMVWRDRAVQDQLEPGSTIKSFVVARAIEEGVLRSNELLYCEQGVWPHAGRKLHDTHPVAWATPASVLRESSNICAAKIGEKLGKEKLIDGLRAAGRTVAAMLEEVVEKGTGTRAALSEYRAAGKTGTAQKVDPVKGGYSEKRLASFLGFAPADAPRVAILVVIDEPEGKGADVAGGTVAAPAWGAIAHEALRQLDVMPEQVKESAPILVSSVGSGAADEAAREPTAGLPIRPGQARVPDVSGLGARSAMRRLAQSSLEPELRGSGRAVAQSPRAGAIVKRGARVKVTLAPPG